jgi:hypothetical protein
MEQKNLRFQLKSDIDSSKLNYNSKERQVIQAQVVERE